MPEKIPVLPADFLKMMEAWSFADLAFELSKLWFEDDIGREVLRSMVDAAFNFEVPLVSLNDNISVLELFHGPTLAFKDFAARFMARMMAYFLQDASEDLTILVATSGDTGSAVAHGFFGVPRVRVVILYPSGKVSKLQEQQLTTMGGNITALEVDGTFDDCQRLVKQAFGDDELRRSLSLGSANSINILRLLPQSFYYFYAYAHRLHKDWSVIFAVPSGNFGNLTAGLIAKKMGLPVAKFVVATNCNDVVPQYLDTGRFEPQLSKQTISNAMDVGNPSNFVRMQDLYGGSVEAMRQDIMGYSFDDDQTRSVMCEVFEKYHYVLDPHGAVAYLGLQRWWQENDLKNSDQKFSGIFLETAHPAKFLDVVELTLHQVLHQKIEIPERLGHCLALPKKALRLANSFTALKHFLLA